MISIFLRLSRISRCLPLFLLPTLARAEAADPAPASALSLPALVREITAHHPELEFYEAEIAAAKAGRRTAGRLADPEVALTLGHKQVRDAAGAAAGDGTAWSVSVLQIFDWPGRLDLRKAIANQQVTLAELGLARFRHALGARARTLAYGLHAAQAKAAAAHEVAGRFAALRATFLAREPAGVTPLLETRVIEAAELALQRRAIAADLALSSALIELNQLRGAPPDAPLRVVAPQLLLHEAPAREALLAAAYENNFSYRLRRAELEQQGLAGRLARSERTPAITAGPFVSREEAGDRETIVGLSLSVPLPVTGRSRAAVDLGDIRQRQAETAALLARREVEKDVLIAAHAFATQLAETRRWSSDASEKFREAAELADRHYRLGAVPVATYIELQQSYLDAVEALLDTQGDALTAGLKLQELTGLDLALAEVMP